MNDDMPPLLALIILAVALVTTLIIFHGDLRCLVVECVIVKEAPHAR